MPSTHNPSGFRCLLSVPALSLLFSLPAAAETQALEAELRIDAAAVEPNAIPRNLAGKFCEHLGANIYNGMDAQILRNPTFAEFPFATGQMSADGFATYHFEREKIDNELQRQTGRYGWPDSDLPELVASRHDGLAAFWSRYGGRDAVQVSPDTGPAGGRAQRLELKPGGGIKQWTWLPLHRTRSYRFELMARSPDLTELTLIVLGKNPNVWHARAKISGLKNEWAKLSGTLELGEQASASEPHCVLLSSEASGQVVIRHFFLRPADEIDGADPDVVRLLKEAHLPLLRWPGGNFVSAYHWEDGIGPTERRPTLPNYAWGGVEPNTFGTDEFIAFCRAVGCEPMICINAGTGTPDEAARWIEYCNGPVSSPQGARRAANGHPESYNILHWEVGNELWGKWQAHWTTAAGYVDRFHQFAKAMQAADPRIELHACGAPVLWGKAWNDTFIRGAGPQLRSITDHPLIGGDVTRNTAPLDVFRDFMHVPDILERKWGELRGQMDEIHEPRLAVTELQMFAHLGRGSEGAEKLNRDNLVNPGTLGEALYDTLIYHAAARLQPFVELITHSATVNHGGGLRKEHERVYANPCYYAEKLFADFGDAHPVKVGLQAPTERAPIVLPEIKNAGGETSFPIIAALAARTRNGELLVSLVHRGTAGPVRLRITVEGFSPEDNASGWTVGGQEPWAANTLELPNLIQPVATELAIKNNSLDLQLQPYSVMQLRLRPRK